jgi:hypothetical protein
MAKRFGHKRKDEHRSGWLYGCIIQTSQQMSTKLVTRLHVQQLYTLIHSVHGETSLRTHIPFNENRHFTCSRCHMRRNSVFQVFGMCLMASVCPCHQTLLLKARLRIQLPLMITLSEASRTKRHTFA